ncbi:MAG: M13-type metalloendopeptidase, partial [Arsenophonus endosymbiont of Dermacentor nuttalli]
LFHVIVANYHKKQDTKIDGLAVNGKLTLGENIGDLGRLNIALNAYKQFAKEHYPNGEPPIIDGMTGLQRFFIAWARTWQELANKEAVRNKIMTDPHSPNPYRANGVVRNMDDWYGMLHLMYKKVISFIWLLKSGSVSGKLSISGSIEPDKLVVFW